MPERNRLAAPFESADMPRASQHREVSKTTQAWGSTRAACAAHLLGMWLDKEGTCFASSLMRERYPPSPVLRTAVIFTGSCPG
jgi:hypothetical protein